jgi:hypothetical protein
MYYLFPRVQFSTVLLGLSQIGFLQMNSWFSPKLTCCVKFISTKQQKYIGRRRILKRRVIITTTVLIVIFSLATPLVIAHTPLGTQGNESIDTATAIPDPTKSWALYSALNSDGDAQYYTFNISSGQTIHVLMYKSLRPEDTNFYPVLILMGQNVNATGDIPTKISVPSRYNAQLIHPTTPQSSYEPFSPGILSYVTDLTIDNAAAGKYYLVVYEASSTPTGGHYGLAIGDRETYTIDEWILIPINLISIYQWEGQSLALILAPMIATLIVGISIVTWRFKKQRAIANPQAWLGAIAGLTFIGTGATTLYQMLAAATQVAIGAEAIITLIFAVIPLAIGVVTLRLSVKNSDKASLKKRIYYIILGVAALFMWAGLIIGPILAILASVMPTSLKNKQKHKLP